MRYTRGSKIENGMLDTSWWDKFTKYYDGVLEESDGYVDEPEILICELAPIQTLKIEFHPGDTVYFINDKQIACTGGHYDIQVIPFKELLNSIKDRQIFLLLLPLAVIDNQDTDEATQIISNVLQKIFDKHLCSQYAGCIVTGLISEWQLPVYRSNKSPKQGAVTIPPPVCYRSIFCFLWGCRSRCSCRKILQTLFLIFSVSSFNHFCSLEIRDFNCP